MTGERKPPLVIVHLIAPNRTRWTQVDTESINQEAERRNSDLTNQGASTGDAESTNQGLRNKEEGAAGASSEETGGEDKKNQTKTVLWA